jgi:PadR family transcriptional regulator PadR
MTEPTQQLLRGTLHVLILQTVAGGELHGYGIVARIAERSGGLLSIEDGALYQALHRMQERGWLDSEWGHAENGKRARFYRLTAEGRRRLKLETASWMAYAEAVFAVLSPATS